MMNCLYTHGGITSKAVSYLANFKKEGFRYPITTLFHSLSSHRGSLGLTSERLGLKHSEDSKVQTL